MHASCLILMNQNIFYPSTLSKLTPMMTVTLRRGMNFIKEVNPPQNFSVCKSNPGNHKAKNHKPNSTKLQSSPLLKCFGEEVNFF